MKRAILTAGLAALAATLLAAAPPGEGDAADAQSPTVDTPAAIRIVSSDHRVLFPSQIEFTLRAESDSPITGISIHYRLGERPYYVYGYPAFDPGTAVTATFIIESDRAAYLPSGLDIEYHYLIEDASGRSLRTDVYGLTYLDPSFDWRSITLESIEVLWHDRPRSEVEAAAAEVDRRLAEVRRVLGLESAPVMRAVIINGRAEAARSFAPISRAASESHLYAGFAYAGFDLFLLAGVGVRGMMHEMAHLLLDEAIASPLGRIPSWYDEGLAMYFEPGSPGTDPAVLSAGRTGSLLTLTSMRGQPGRPGDVRLFYSQARSLVAYMIETYGEDKVTEVIAEVGTGTRFEDAVRSAYGLDPAGLEDEWRASIGALPLTKGQSADADPAAAATPSAERPERKEPGRENEQYEPSLRADPGTFGTSLLLALAASFAAAVTGGGWLLRRRRTARRSGEEEPEGFDPRYDTPP